MMSTTTSVVLAAGIAAVGTWAKEKNAHLPMKWFVGVAVVSIGLAAMSEMNADFAQKFGLLLVVASLFYYGVPISKALGYTK